jgi:hypothetical protein
VGNFFGPWAVLKFFDLSGHTFEKLIANNYNFILETQVDLAENLLLGQTKDLGGPYFAHPCSRGKGRRLAKVSNNF